MVKPYPDDKEKSRHRDKHTVREERMTYDDYAGMPDDGMRYELASGRLEAMTPAPQPRHQMMLQKLLQAIEDTCSHDYIVLIAPVDVILSNLEVRQPDLLMLHKSRLTLLTNRGIEGPPDLVAEVLSPGSIKRDREDKLKVYAHYGVSEYWIVDMNNGSLEQYVLDQGAYTLAEVYVDDTPVRSNVAACVNFSIKDTLDAIPKIPD